MNTKLLMGHRVGKIVFKGCVRQSAVRSSISSSAKVNAKSSSTSQPSANFSQPRQHIAYTRNLSSKNFKMSLHIKARCKIYPRETDVVRCPVPDEKVPWSVDFLDYEPVNFTSNSVLKQPVWADPPDPSEIQGFNTVDTKYNVNRKTYEGGDYEVVNGYPRNPRGRTGVTGRGCLGRWGPNHAADPIVTRWKRNEDNEIVIGGDGKPILQFVSVQRRDNGEWALPGGMVDPGENRTATLIREFGEEALNTLEKTDEEKANIKKMLTDLFVNKGDVIYKGYVDDPRNTDNSWMETKAINFHDDEGTGVGAFQLHAGDDAQAVQWKDIDSGLVLYASHIDFIKETVRRRNAHWDNSPV